MSSLEDMNQFAPEDTNQMSGNLINRRIPREPIGLREPIDPRDPLPRPRPPRIFVSVGISSPANGTTFVGLSSGVPVTIQGNAEASVFTDESDFPLAVANVEVAIGEGGAFRPATPGPGGDWSNWSFSTTLPAGTHKITAKATSARFSGITGKTQTASITISVVADSTAPTLTISPLPNGGRVFSNEPLFPVQVFGNAVDTQTRVSVVECSVDGGPFQRARPDVEFGWVAWLFETRVPYGRHTITVRAIDQMGNTATGSVTVEAVDAIAPELKILSPQDNATLTGSEDGLTLDIQGTTADSQAGVRVVEWDLDGRNQYVAAVPQSPGNWSTWSARVAIPTPGTHRIAVRAIDHAGNSTATLLTVAIALPFEVQDPNDIVSPLAYLSDVLDFATRRVKVAANGPAITKKLLADTFYQPFDRLIKPELRQAATEPVHQVRLCVEVLRKYLSARPPARQTNANFSLAAAEAEYRQAAYQTLLNKLGTSYEEIRLARIADAATRKRLAQQLSISLRLSRPDQLDRLFLPLEQVTEADLAQIFGLPPTTGDRLQSLTKPEPELLTWQLETLQSLWQQQDADPLNSMPILDPDLVSLHDLKNPTAGNLAFDLWQERQQWIANQLSQIKAKREQEASPQSGFNRIVSEVLGPIEDLLIFKAQHDQGKNIEAQLQARSISLNAFLHLLRIDQLAATGTVLASEWADVYSILVQVQKQRVYPNWRAVEQQRRLILSPDTFKLAVGDLESASLPPTVELPVWRATPEARQAWQDTLMARISQRQAIAQALQTLIDDTEQATLPLLRDALVKTVGGGESSLDLTNELTQQLAIDVKNSGAQKTTRIHQAIETLQAILFSLRTGRFEEADTELEPSPASQWRPNFTSEYTEEMFDQEWKWIGSYATWRAAMFVFGYPENLLLPSLRETHQPVRPQDPTAAFRDLVDELRSQQNLTPQQARDAAKTYLQTLRSSGITLPEALNGFELTDQRSEQELTDYLAVKAAQVFGSTPLQTVPVYLKEIFYFVPMQLALQLQKAGQYLTALDWFQTVYAYNLSVSKRKIYPGLRIEESLPTEYRRTIGWLLDSLNPHDIAATRANAYTRFTLISLVRCLLEFADSEFTRDTNESIPRARSLYVMAIDLLDLPEMQPPSNANIPFPPNPVVASLRLHAELSLFKLRQGRNIAGMERQAEPVTANPLSLSDVPVIGSGGQLVLSKPVALKPTPYYYTVLIERAKQLVNIAQQIEAAFLSALEKRDAEAYNLIKAGQDLRLAGAGVQLQDLRVNEADRGINLAQVQQQRSQVQHDTYQDWINAGLNQYESKLIQTYKDANRYRNWLASVDASLTVAQAATTAAAGGWQGSAAWIGVGVITALTGTKTGFTTALNNAETRAQIYSLNASYERRTQEWQLQKSLAAKDIEIGLQQILLAQDHSQVVKQERAISQLQADHAQVTVDFLSNKFTNSELYEWMSGILGRVYSYFLQQATAVAQLAQAQLAFERQETPPAYIQADYWQAPSDASSSEDQRNRRGLTGSARLLQDIYQLDQYAFETNKRKLQLTQTFSLAQLFPYEFQQFRETGRLPFATPMELFDRAFPGHYLRLIKRVRTSVIALIPPTQGIRATLVSSGVSRVVIGGDLFQQVVVRRNPELVALTSPSNATGLFELDAQSDLLLPFEGMGVDTTWELQMPKAANPFDYRTIADVLITVEYTALHSFDYRQQVVRSLRPNTSSDRTFSLRNEFPDEWYNLHNPDQDSSPMTVKFNSDRDDFPPNLENLKIQQVMLYFIRAEGTSFEVPVEHLRLKQGNDVVTGQGTTSVDGIISTRRGNGTGWVNLLNKVPVGEWELALPNTEAIKNRFRQGQIEDIMLVISYSGRTPAWPV